MSNFVLAETKLFKKLENIKTPMYKKLVEELVADILLADTKSLNKTRKKLESAKKILSLKSKTDKNKQKAANIDLILETMDAKNNSVSSKSSSKSSSPKKSKKQISPLFKSVKKTTVKKVKAKSPQKATLVNVDGDGNCFYRALYGAAKTHPDNNLAPKIRHLFKGQNNGPITEESFIADIRKAVAEKIGNGIYDTINEDAKDEIRTSTEYETEAGRQRALETQLTFFEDMRRSAFQKKASRYLFENWLQESSDEIKAAFGVTKFKRNYKKPEDAAKFYKDLAKIISDPGVYASQTDIDVVKWVLKKADINVHPDIGEPKVFTTKNAKGANNLWLKKDGDHYQYWKLL